MDTWEVVAPSALPLERLEAEITELAGHLAAAECRWLLLVAEFDDREGHPAWGCRRERLRVAHALTGLPTITQAFSEGRLSYSKVRALTRIATRENEADLAMLGEHATAAPFSQRP
jgi:hypothetical protein